MEVKVFERVHPREYFNLFSEKGIRPDGRSLTGSRKTAVRVGSISTALGSAMVKCGSTTMLCGTTAKVVNPTGAKAEFAPIDVNVELLPLCSGKYRPGRKPEESYHLQELVAQHVRRLVQPSSLELEFDDMMWSLSLDIYCLEDDGNMEDAILLVAIAALKDTRLPEILSTEEGYHATKSRTRSIDFRELIVPVSFGVVDSRVVVDPDSSEEALCEAKVTIFVDEKGSFRGMSKSGGSVASKDLLATCSKLAVQRAPALFSQLSN
uniref:Ribosomal RNA-processing protein 43 n=1 Tax=Rhodosorus marinus TaxID=101924 RepID=A0A7S3A8S2_9RHOD|mmetsp:Transcript_5837/g.24552  ORF Transcript_5837/g.24552 Transcript_5837/m.24552 type:complete len:265 (+) Transcript_5837:179-973(+)